MGKSNLEGREKFDFTVSRNQEMRLFKREENRIARDILEIGVSLFELEKQLKKHSIKEFEIHRFVNTHQRILANLLSDLVSYVLLEAVNFKFANSDTKLNKSKSKESQNKTEAIVLFSGGIDSFSGIYWAKQYFKDIQGVFCAHSDQVWSIHIVNKIVDTILKSDNLQINKVYVPSMTKGGYSQLRGFLYILSAGSYLKILNSNNLVISECGPTMYQPKFGLYDSVTMTTHPFVVDSASKALKTLLEKEINVYLPFENMTKAEVIALSHKPSTIKETHSCISQRFGKHDGTCYGCIIRRLGAIVAGVEDTVYSKNPIIDPFANNDNLISLLLFSRSLLIDYKNMPFYQIENIEGYGKKELFERFALDSFSAIYLLKQQKLKLTKVVDIIYKDFISIIGESRLEQRIEYVRDKRFKININPHK
jgi:7-cyano-7-deazaguanine synthase in queuosine biosynthesis